MPEKPVLPKMNSATLEGFTLTVKCYGTWPEFVRGLAQAGDPKGSVVLEGPGVRVLLGNWLFPVNLADARDLTDQLGEKIRGRHRQEPNWQLLHDLAEKAFGPYTSKYWAHS